MKYNKLQLIWLGMFIIALSIGTIIGALIPIPVKDNSYPTTQLNKISFIETANRENYDFNFPVGNKIYGVTIDNSSDLFYKDDLGNILGLNTYAVQWTIIYTSYLKIQEQQIQINDLNNTINLLCNANPLIC